MPETILPKPRRKAATEYEVLAAQLIAEMSLLEEQMDRDRSRSEQFKAETQALKVETDIIKARTAETLSKLIQQINNLTRST